jgi:hypothetical protein
MRLMRRRAPFAALALVGLLSLAAGCGAPSDHTPVACLEGAHAYLRALQQAPGGVRLAGQTPISDCLAKNQTGGDLAAVGTATVSAATRLNAEARAQPGDAANLQLGYLLGAATHGAEDTEGIHADLIRRLVAAARYSPDNRPLPRAFYMAYRSGYAAGERNG